MAEDSGYGKGTPQARIPVDVGERRRKAGGGGGGGAMLQRYRTLDMAGHRGHW